MKIPSAQPGPSIPIDSAPLQEALALRQIAKNGRFSWVPSLLSHGIVSLAITLAGLPLAGALNFVLSVLLDHWVRRNCDKTFKRLSKPDATTDLGGLETGLSGVVLIRACASMVAPAALFWADPVLQASAIGLVLAGNLAVMIVLTSPLLRVMIRTTWPCWLGMVTFCGWQASQAVTLTTGIVSLAYMMCLLWLAFYMTNGQRRLTELIAEKDAHSAQLAASVQRHERDAALFASLEADLQIGFFDFDVDQNRLTWSPGTFRAYGRPVGDVAPSQSDRIAQLDPEDIESVKAVMDEIARKPGSYRFTCLVHGLDGIARDVTSFVQSVADAEGKVRHIFGMVDDQTALRRLLKRSEDMERRLETALHLGNSMAWDYEFPSQEVIAYGAVEHFLRPDQDRSRPLVELFQENVLPEDSQALTDATRMAYITGQPQSVEFGFQLEEGRGTRRGKAVVSVTGRPMKDKGTIRSFVTDVTDAAEHAAALDLARSNAESATMAKSAFLANMSHEIRTPLNGVIAVAGALAREDLAPQHRELVDIICQSGTSLERVLNDVLDLARVESGRLELEMAPFNLNELVNGLNALHSMKARDKSLNFNDLREGDLDIWLLGDAVRIRQILGNLLSNAIKFTENGAITLQTHVAHGVEGRAVLTFNVSDTGHGISQDDQKRLFSRFEQLDGSITRAHGGSGLGLAICQSLAELLGGRVTVASALGQGSVFTLCLELMQVEEPTVHAGAGVRSDGSDTSQPALRILAADDHPTNRRVLQLILEPLGVDLVLCEDGQQALDIWEDQSFDVILMDLQMPVMDGLTAISQIREREMACNREITPILAVSANAMAHHRKEALIAGADGHVAKPFTPDLLLASIESVLAGEAPSGDSWDMPYVDDDGLAAGG